MTATFYFDLGSPYAYLAAERLPTVFSEPVQWQPVLLGGLFKLANRSSWAVGDPHRRATGMAEIERRARAYGLPDMRWPDSWPSDYLFAMRVATFAAAAGSGVTFARQAFRAAFVHGRDLSIPVNVLAAAETAGLAPDRAQTAAQDDAIKHQLREATSAAYDRGVTGVPTVAVGDRLFWGDDQLEAAASLVSNEQIPPTKDRGFH